MAHRYFPFQALGLRCNPFRALTDEEWAEVALLPDEILGLAAVGFVHLQLLGARGHGKTTILLALAARFRREGRRAEYEYLPEGQAKLRTDLRRPDILLLDEAQRLSTSEWERLLAAAGRLRLVLSSHHDLSGLFARRGLPLASARLGPPSAAQLRAVLDRRLSYFALPPDSAVRRVTFTPDAVRYLRHTFGGDQRAAQHFLYEVFQRLRRPAAITADHLQAEAAVIGGEGRV